jgi:hypothetical protein
MSQNETMSVRSVLKIAADVETAETAIITAAMPTKGVARGN